MSLGQHLADQILLEEKKITKVVAIYPGRFQPMGKHHAQVYNQLSSKFDDVWVATSGKVDLPKSPFSFSEKKKIIKDRNCFEIILKKNAGYWIKNKSKELNSIYKNIVLLKKIEKKILRYQSY